MWIRRYLAPLLVCALLVPICPRLGRADMGDCGQPLSNGPSPTATDALRILRAAVGIDVCLRCTCDVDGSGAITAADALRGLVLSIGIEIDLLCEECTTEAIDLRSGEVESSISELVAAAAGGTVELEGARLEIPPGALAQDAVITLAAIPVDSLAIPVGDDAFGGQIPLSDHVFVFTSDQDVDLNGAFEVVLPIDPARLDVEHEESDIHVSTVIGGFMVPQGPPARLDLINGEIAFDLSLPSLRAGYADTLPRTPPMAAGIPFVGLIQQLGNVHDTSLLLPDPSVTAGRPAVLLPAIASQWHALLATIDDIKQVAFTFDSLDFGPVRIRYRSSLVEFSQAVAVGVALDDAHELYVETMGFSLPNFFNLDGLYTFYIDDFANHFFIDEDVAGRIPDGFTLPGSGLFEGASYVNAARDSSEWAAIAVHEYFHALQAGAITSPFTTANIDRVLGLATSWLFEGTAAALAGRLTYGGGSAPARNRLVEKELPQLRPIFSLGEADPADVAQELFLYLEKAFGNVDFYLPLFESLGSPAFDVGGGVNRGVAVVDQVLRDLSSGTSSLSAAWRDFIEDRAILSADDYNVSPGQLMAERTIDLSTNGPVALATVLPSLSYYVVRINVPPVDAGDPTDTERDVTVRVRILGDDFLLLHVWLDGDDPFVGLPTKVQPLGPGTAEELVFKDVRSATAAELRVVAGNANLFSAETITFEIETELSGDEPVRPILTDAAQLTYGDYDLPPMPGTRLLRDRCGVAFVDEPCPETAPALPTEMELQFSIGWHSDNVFGESSAFIVFQIDPVTGIASCVRFSNDTSVSSGEPCSNGTPVISIAGAFSDLTFGWPGELPVFRANAAISAFIQQVYAIRRTTLADPVCDECVIINETP